MEHVPITVDDIQTKITDQLQRMAKTGNKRETASFVQSIAETLNSNDDSKSTSQKESSEDNEKKKKVNNTLTLTPLPSLP